MQKQAAPISIRGRLFFCGERYIVFFIRYRGVSADQNESAVRQNIDAQTLVDAVTNTLLTNKK